MEDKICILINVQQLKFNGKSGVPFFIEKIKNELKKNPRVTVKELYFPLIVRKNGKYDEKSFTNKVLNVIYKKAKKYLYPFLFYITKADFYIETEYKLDIVKKTKKTKIINFIYDIGLVLFDEINTKAVTKGFREMLPTSIKKSDLIISISKSSSEDIKNYIKETLGIEKKVDYIYCDSTINKDNSINTKQVIRKWNLVKKYFLYLGTIEPRKNPLNTIKGFHRFIEDNKDIDIDFVFAGKKGWMYDEIFDYIKENKLENRVIFTGYISDVEKYSLIKEAKAFVFLSVYEGFGIPPLEALKLGTPVLLSDIPVFRELFNGNAYYSKYDDIMEISKIMKEVIDNPIEIDRKLLEKYSWEKSVEKLLGIMLRENYD